MTPTKPKHTPTPWVASGGNILQADGERRSVAITAAPIRHGKCDEDEAAANAKHIVACVNACEGLNPEAVPKLLEALKEAVQWLDSMSDTTTEFKKDTERYRAAIAKAESRRE